MAREQNESLMDVDCGLTAWEGARREQLRRWSELVERRSIRSGLYACGRPPICLRGVARILRVRTLQQPLHYHLLEMALNQLGDVEVQRVRKLHRAPGAKGGQLKDRLT